MLFRVMVFLIAMILMVPFANAQPGVHTARTGGEVLRLIRNEKLDLILPGVMRDNNVDMWIHVTRSGDPDPMVENFGSTSGYLIFTNLGDRIERAVFGSGGAVENIDIRGSRDIARAISGYNYRTQDFSVYNELRDFVTERDPKTIAVNTSDWLAIADGISHSQYVKLEKILGQKYSARIISAENLITEFRTRRTLREVAVMTNSVEVHRQILERSLSNEVITPGVTTREDVGWWVKEEFFKRGLTRGYSTGVGTPVVIYSAVSDRSVTGSPQYVLQRGDFLQFDNGVRYLDYFSTDYKRNAYILRKGETSIPQSLQHGFDRSLAARDIIRENVKVGRTAGETLKAIVSALEDAGYIYTPYVDSGPEDHEMVLKALANTDKTGISIDLHSQGHHGGSLVTVGPSIAPFRSDRDHLIIPENHLFSFEFITNTNIPERPSYPLRINIEGNHIVSSRGVEFLHPPNEKILLIH